MDPPAPEVVAVSGGAQRHSGVQAGDAQAEGMLQEQREEDPGHHGHFARLLAG